jgi:hypothetical protein
MKIKKYVVITDAISDGIDEGWARAHKHTDTPTEHVIKTEMAVAIMNQLNYYFEFDSYDE